MSLTPTNRGSFLFNRDKSSKDVIRDKLYRIADWFSVIAQMLFGLVVVVGLVMQVGRLTVKKAELVKTEQTVKHVKHRRGKRK